MRNGVYSNECGINVIYPLIIKVLVDFLKAGVKPLAN